MTPDQYDDLYNKASKIIAELNPCKVTSVGGVVSCYASRCGDKPNMCCSECKHLTQVGCSVEALGCKMWLCHSVTYTPEGKKAALKLAKLGNAWNFGYRQSKQEFFQISR